MDHQADPPKDHKHHNGTEEQTLLNKGGPETGAVLRLSQETQVMNRKILLFILLHVDVLGMES